MSKSLLNKFKKVDMFGISVPLFYKDDEVKKRSTFGAIMTIIVCIIVLLFVGMTLVTLNQYETYTIKHVSYDRDLEP